MRNSVLRSSVASAALMAMCGGAYAANSGIETVVVTAEKRAQDEQTVPISMTVITADQLRQFNTHSLVDLSTNVPGLTMSTGPQNNGIYLRGFGSSASNPAFDQAVSVYQDGVYFGQSRQLMAPFFDVARIEVLKGPQGALVGKNTAAGAISIVTNDPTDVLEAAGTLTYNFDRAGPEASGFVSGPITDQLSGRVAVQLSDLDGYVTNIGTGQKEPQERHAFGRVSLKYDPASNFSVTTKFGYGQLATKGWPGVAISDVVRQPLPTTKNEASGFDQYPWVGYRSKQHGYNSATVAQWSFDGYTLESITGFTGFKSDKYTLLPPLNPSDFNSSWSENFNQQSEELRLLSPVGNTIEYFVGAHVDHSDMHFTQVFRYDLLNDVLNGQIHSNYKQQETSWSVFGSATWHITDALRLQGTARYTGTHKSGDFQQFLDFGVPFAGPIALHQKLSEGEFDPSVTVQYDLRPGIMAYASYARGSKSGGFNATNTGVTASTFAFAPEHSKDYEVGMKATLLNGNLVLDADAYILKFKNLQVSGYDSTVNALVTTNAAAATSKGFEGAVTWQAFPGLQIRADGAYIYAAYDDYPGAKCIGIEAEPCDPATNNIAGTVLQRVPRWSGTLQADYTRPVGENLMMSLTGIVKYRSSVWVDDDNYDPVIGLQGTSAKIDARIGFGSASGSWEVALVGKNLTDQITRSYALSWPLQSATPGEPQGVAVVNEGRSIAIQLTGRL